MSTHEFACNIPAIQYIHVAMYITMENSHLLIASFSSSHFLNMSSEGSTVALLSSIPLSAIPLLLSASSRASLDCWGGGTTSPPGREGRN